MLYATAGAFEALIGARETLALTDEDNDGVVDVGRLEAALAAASADIDGVLGKYAADLAASNARLLETACIHFARWHLSGGSVTEIDPVKQRRDAYMKILLDLADGVAGNQDAGGAAGVAHGGKARMSSGGRVFGRGDRRF